MEFHLGLDARVTKDVDALFRGGLERFEFSLDASIAEPWGRSPSSAPQSRRSPAPADWVKPRRFDLKLLIKGAVWRRIKAEISFPEGHIADGAEPVPAPNAGFFGITTPDHLAGIAMAYQVAQKLHACTDPDDPPGFINDRVRDVVEHAIWGTLWVDVGVLAVLGFIGVSSWTPRFWPRLVGAISTALLGVGLILLKAMIH